MDEGSDVEDVRTENCSSEQQAVELSIVILVDGEEKCSSSLGRPRATKSSTSTHRSVGDQSSRPTTPKSAPSSTSLPSCNNNKISCKGKRNKNRQCANCQDRDDGQCENCGQSINQAPQSARSYTDSVRSGVQNDNQGSISPGIQNGNSSINPTGIPNGNFQSINCGMGAIPITLLLKSSGSCSEMPCNKDVLVGQQGEGPQAGQQCGNVGGNAGQMGGTMNSTRANVGQQGGPDMYQMGGNMGQMGGNMGQMGGNMGQMGGNMGQMGGAMNQMGGGMNQMGGGMNQMGEAMNQSGGCMNQGGGGMNQMGGATNQMGGATNQMGGNMNQTSANMNQMGSNNMSQMGGNMGQTGCNQMRGNITLIGGNMGQMGGFNAQMSDNRSQLAGNMGQRCGTAGQVGGNTGQAYANTGQMGGIGGQTCGNNVQMTSNAGQMGDIPSQMGGNIGQRCGNAVHFTGNAGQMRDNSSQMSETIGQKCANNVQFAGNSGQMGYNNGPMGSNAGQRCGTTGQMVDNSSQMGSSVGQPCGNTGQMSSNLQQSTCTNTNQQTGGGCPHTPQNCPFLRSINEGQYGMSSFNQPRAVPTDQSNCPCAAFRNAVCTGAPLTATKSQTAACQTVSYGECQTDATPQTPMAPPCQGLQIATSTTRLQTASCQTAQTQMQQTVCPQQTQPICAPQQTSAGTTTQPICGPQKCQTKSGRPCTPKKKCCKKKAKSAICQTQQTPQTQQSRTTLASAPQQTCMQRQQSRSTLASAPQQTCVSTQSRTTVQSAPQGTCMQPVQATCGQPEFSMQQTMTQSTCAPQPQDICAPQQQPMYAQPQQGICGPVPVAMEQQGVCGPFQAPMEQQGVCVPVQQQQQGVCVPVQQQQQGVCISGEQGVPTPMPVSEGGPPMEAASEVEEPPKPRHKHKRRSREEKREPPEARRARRSSLPPDQLNFAHFPTVQLNFVDYFLKSEGGVASVLSLAQIKLEYEKKCKSLLANMSSSKRTQAEEFFNRIIEAIQVKVPESNYTEIKHYNLTKYLQPIVGALHLHAHDEVHHINKYHGYILSVVSFMEERLRQKQVVNPDAMIDIETHLLAGIMSRFYPLFIQIKETAVKLGEQADSSYTVSSDEFIKQLRKLILAIYVEIVCIDVTFNNTLTSLNYLPSVEVQEKYRQQMAIRKKHARHAVTWAARCITTVLLGYHIETALIS